eukprot:758402-Hanusia_phi.AAC.6
MEESEMVGWVQSGEFLGGWGTLRTDFRGTLMDRFDHGWGEIPRSWSKWYRGGGVASGEEFALLCTGGNVGKMGWEKSNL